MPFNFTGTAWFMCGANCGNGGLFCGVGSSSESGGCTTRNSVPAIKANFTHSIDQAMRTICYEIPFPVIPVLVLGIGKVMGQSTTPFE